MHLSEKTSFLDKQTIQHIIIKRMLAKKNKKKGDIQSYFKKICWIKKVCIIY